ncbi:MAG: MAPEG family protein [Pseudomonadota bacterium]
MIDPSPDLFAVFALVLALLIVKAQVLAVSTALTRKSLMTFVIPEDAEWLGGDHTPTDLPKVRRIFRAHQNDLEALLPFFIGGTLYLASGAPELIGILYFVAFALARFAHSFAYLTKRPALRRNAFATAWLLNIVIAVHACGVILLMVI